jgi:hypothetical protein
MIGLRADFNVVFGIHFWSVSSPELPSFIGFLDLRPLFWALFRRVLDRTFLFIFGPLLES